jgi:hypothetical protein
MYQGWSCAEGFITGWNSIKENTAWRREWRFFVHTVRCYKICYQYHVPELVSSFEWLITAQWRDADIISCLFNGILSNCHHVINYILLAILQFRSSEICKIWASQSGGYEVISFSACFLLYAGLLLGVLFDLEDGREMFFQNVGWLSVECRVLHPKRQNAMKSICNEVLRSLNILFQTGFSLKTLPGTHPMISRSIYFLFQYSTKILSCVGWYAWREWRVIVRVTGFIGTLVTSLNHT